jgi:CBS domain-containing protein
MRALPVAQAMSTRIVTAPADMLLTDSAAELDRAAARALLILGRGGAPDGIATVQDIEAALLDNQLGLTLGEVATRPVVTVYADESLSQAVQKMGVRDVGQVPVVTRGTTGQVVGMLNRADVVRAYSGAMLERVESQTRQPIRPGDLRGTRLVEVLVDAGGPLVGRTVAELHLPRDMLVVAVHRRAETLIPRGDTRLLAGDSMQILVRDEVISTLHEHLASLPLAPAV